MSRYSKNNNYNYRLRRQIGAAVYNCLRRHCLKIPVEGRACVCPEMDTESRQCRHMCKNTAEICCNSSIVVNNKLRRRRINIVPRKMQQLYVPFLRI
jgi:hypothetical protein